jgi:hypothetical protein
VIARYQRDIEFKHLAEWYRDNAGPRERLATTFAGVVGLYVSDRRTNFVHTGTLKADDPNDVVGNLRTNGITYIAWDSRVGSYPNSRYYQLWGLENIAALAESESTGPYEFITQVRGQRDRHINVFRLRSTDQTP